MASTVRRTREERRRSDGTRRSVLHEVSRTVVKNGEIGDVNWNARGDLLEAPITILRVQKGDPRRRSRRRHPTPLTAFSDEDASVAAARRFPADMRCWT